MVGLLIAAPTLITAARWLEPEETAAAVPNVGAPELLDLGDVLKLAAMPTMGLLAVEMTREGKARFALPRSENGQGITTSTAMIIADELDLPLDKVEVVLADARPELLYNQLTGASNTTFAIYDGLRMAAATMRGRLTQTAALELGALERDLRTADGVVIAPDGRRVPYAALAEKAAALRTVVARPQLKQASQLKLTGTEVKRIDARAAVTGTKTFAMDLKVKNAIPTMLCRAPTINARALGIENAAEVRRMPGVEHVALIEKTEFVQGGVAVCARTMGQCIDAIRALKVRWSAGKVDGKNDASVLADLKKAQLPFVPVPAVKTIEGAFTFHFRPGDPLETNTAVADVRADRAEIWSAMKSPIVAQQGIATMLGLPQDKVVCHVVEGGGSFGRRLFPDAAFEAAAVSKAVGRPVRLQWHRTDNFRHGRTHPMAFNRTRAQLAGKEIVAFDQRHSSVQTDYTHGLGELLTAVEAKLPAQNFAAYSSALFYLTAVNPYNVGVGQPLLSEVYDYADFNTSSTRNVYNPDMGTSREVVMDAVARELGEDPLELRLRLAKDERTKAVIRRVKEAAEWGRSLPAGVAQGIAVHSEYKGRAACIVEIDCRPQTVNRKVRDALTGPRVQRLTFVVDVGKPINPLGIKAQIMGGAMDGIANALTYSLHLRDGYFLEGSWDNAFYTRQWNVPPRVDVIVMPATTDVPGGVGEFGVAAAMAATANAYWKATGTMPTEFPILHNRKDLGFEPQPTVPPIPQPPADGLVAYGVRPARQARRTKPKRRRPRRRTRRSPKTSR
jgi:isoquinoline 1-oxidoreductase beta subunit